MMSSLITWEDALGRVLSLAKPFGVTQIGLADACGRVTAGPILARVCSPRFDNSAVDGFALGVLGPGVSGFEIVGDSFAGSDVGGVVDAGQAVRVLTGAPVPGGTDRVVMQEDCRFDGGGISCDDLGRAGQHIRREGEDFVEGAELLGAGHLLNPGSLGLLASGGVSDVEVFRKPMVGLLTTGNEVRNMGEALQSGEIFNSNAIALNSALEEIGVEAVLHRHVGDDCDQTVESLMELVDRCDVVVTVGGLADGERDHVLGALQPLGGEVVLSRVAIKPGKPFSVARVGSKVVFCLPGNPVSALVTAVVFVRPFLLKGLGLKGEPGWSSVSCGDSFLKKVGRAEFVPGWVRNGEFLSNQVRGSHMLTTLAEATHLGLLPSEKSRMEIGESLRVMSFDWRLN